MKSVNYHKYLMIDELLNCQQLESVKHNRPAHDELLFITVHQAYELWFKQILHEVDSILEVFNSDAISEKQMSLIISRLERIQEIQKLMPQQIDVLETMTPLDFLDFRDLLYPASGFQSLQFKLLENKLGLDNSKRIVYNNKPYKNHFADEFKDVLEKSEKEPSLFACVEKWLERIPFLEVDGFDFWKEYRTTVSEMFANEKEIITNNSLLEEEGKELNFKIINELEKVFSALFDESSYEKLRENGEWRLSYKAVHAALLIQLYRDQPVLYLPFRLITSLINIDQALTNWRYRHALMVKRMLGTKVGTGGSSGAKYLKDSTEQHKIFSDFFQLTTFFVPRSVLPELPKSVEKKLGFYYESQK